MANEETLAINALLSHKCNEESHKLGERLQVLLHPFGINLLIDPFPTGVDCDVRMQTFDVEAVIFLCSRESVSSNPVQLELAAADRQGMPIFIAHLSGEIPANLRKRSYWSVPPVASPEFRRGVKNLALAIQGRVGLNRQVRLLHPDNFFHETIEAAKTIATQFDHTLLAEYACELATKFHQISDPSTRFWIVLALGKANTPQAAKLVDELPAPDHPLVLEGIQQAKAMFLNQPPVA